MTPTALPVAEQRALRPTARRRARADTSRARASCGIAPVTATSSWKGRSARAWRRSMPAAALLHNPRRNAKCAANIAAMQNTGKHLRAAVVLAVGFACQRAQGPRREQRRHPRARSEAAANGSLAGEWAGGGVARAAAAHLRERAFAPPGHAAPDRWPARDRIDAELSRRARSERLPRGGTSGRAQRSDRSGRPGCRATAPSSTYC